VKSGVGQTDTGTARAMSCCVAFVRILYRYAPLIDISVNDESHIRR
jgi:hypothetical protein